MLCFKQYLKMQWLYNKSGMHTSLHVDKPLHSGSYSWYLYIYCLAIHADNTKLICWRAGRLYRRIWTGSIG